MEDMVRQSYSSAKKFKFTPVLEIDMKHACLIGYLNSVDFAHAR